MFCVRNIEGSLVHATTDDMYHDKMRKRLSPSQVVSVVRALKTSPDLNLTAVDEQGWTVYHYIHKNGAAIDEGNREKAFKKSVIKFFNSWAKLILNSCESKIKNAIFV